MDEDYSDYSVQLLDVVVEKTHIYGWYYMKLTWNADSIPAPWVDCFYGLSSPVVMPYNELVTELVTAPRV